MGEYARQGLFRNLGDLGVEAGDLLFVHSSFKSIGPVVGGAGAVVSAFEDSVGPEGLILMPSFNLVDFESRAANWDLGTTPSTVGWLTEFFRLMPGTYRSDHYSHSVAARGLGAKGLVSVQSRDGYRSNWDLEPWGLALGTMSPMNQAYERAGKLLMLGVDYTSSTYLHFVEAIYWNLALKENPKALYPLLDREAVGIFWDRVGKICRGFVGDSECRLFGIKEYVEKVLCEISLNPEPYWLDFRLVPGTRDRVYV